MAALRTGTTATAGVATETEFSSAAQRERRQRILDATLALASRGGYDAVQMRAVADRAGVAPGTLYPYFPSKIHLLVSALSRAAELAAAAWRRATAPARGRGGGGAPPAGARVPAGGCAAGGHRSPDGRVPPGRPRTAAPAVAPPVAASKTAPLQRVLVAALRYA